MRTTSARCTALIARGFCCALLVGPASAWVGQASAASPKVSGYPLTPVVAPGERLRLSLTASAGRARTPRTTFRFVLSSDERRSREDLRLRGTTSMPALARRRSRTVSQTFLLPAGAKPGGYHVLACPPRGGCRTLPATVGITPRVERVDATLQPDDSRRASRLVTRAGGGRLEATGGDGTRYALAVPPGSVPIDTTITMTPLAGAQGLPFEGLAGGVKLEPAGLDLDEPARLLMQREGLTVSPGTAAFGSSTGKDLFLTPWVTPPPGEALGPGTVAMGVTHFSGWGVVSLNATQLGAQYSRSAFRARDRIAQDVHRAIKDSGTGVLDDGALRRTQDAFMEQIVEPLLEAAIQDPVFLNDAIEAYVGLEKQLQFLGKAHELPDGPAIASLFKQAFARYATVLRARCAQADFKTIAEALSLARQMELLAGTLPAVLEAPRSLMESLRMMKDCLSFELRMRSRHEEHFSNGGLTSDISLALSSAVPLNGLEQGHASGPLDYDSASGETGGPGCGAPSRIVATYGSTMTVTGGFDVHQLAAGKRSGSPTGTPQAAFTVDVGQPQEIWTGDDCGAEGGPTGHWFEMWMHAVHGRQSDGAPRVIDGFQATGTPGVLARRSYDGTYENPQQREIKVQWEETWELVHTPK